MNGTDRIMKKPLLQICAAAALALPASAFASIFYTPTPIDAEFTALVREVEMAKVRAQKWGPVDKLSKSNEKRDLDALRARLDRDDALSADEKARAIAQERQAIRQRYAIERAQWRAPEPDAAVLAAVTPIYARSYSVKAMRELVLAYNPPFNGKAVMVKENAQDRLDQHEAKLVAARKDAFARNLDASRTASTPAR